MPFILFLLFSLFFPTPSFAQTATVSATPTKSSSKEVLDMVEKKVQSMIQQSSTSSTNTPKGFIGTITQISDSKIIITNNKKETQTLTTTSSTTFVDAKKNKIKFENLKSGQMILIMGYFDQDNNFEAKRIIVTSAETITNNNEIVFGQIADISKTSNVLVLIPIKNKNIQYQIKTDSTTKIVDKNGISSTIDKLKSGQKIIIIIQPDPKIANTFDASKIILM